MLASREWRIQETVMNLKRPFVEHETQNEEAQEKLTLRRDNTLISDSEGTGEVKTTHREQQSPK